MSGAGGNDNGAACNGCARPDEGPDNSLQGNALRRAQQGEVPKTLTPWEWEEWYREKGMPAKFVFGDKPTLRAKWGAILLRWRLRARRWKERGESR